MAVRQSGTVAVRVNRVRRVQEHKNPNPQIVLDCRQVEFNDFCAEWN